MAERSGIQIGSWTVGLAIMVVLIGFWVMARPAIAADQHVLDAAQSLSGTLATTPLDPIPDPGSSHPKKGFNDPCGVATDAYGNVYVANGAASNVEEGVIDVFGPDGRFITEVANAEWPCALAVDASGRMYVQQRPAPIAKVVRYDPLVYKPESGEITYDPVPVVLTGDVEGMGFNPSNDHLFISDFASSDGEFTFEERLPDGSPVLPTLFESVFGGPGSIAVLGSTGDIYSSGYPFAPAYEPQEARVYVIDGVTKEIKLTLPEDSDEPGLDFGFTFGRGGIAVDQSNGDVYVDAIKIHHAIYQFHSDGKYVGEIALPENGLKEAEPFSAIAVDNGEHSPNQGYVYVTSGPTAANAHLYAFAPRNVQPPAVRGERVEEAGESEALLAAEVNPHGATTSYHFEYGPSDCSANPCQSAPVPEGTAGAGGAFQSVSVAVEGLVPGNAYHFRLVAANHCNPLDEGEECVTNGPDHTFATFASEAGGRRVYELVTPPETNGRIPTGAVFGTSGMNSAPVPLASADGESVVFGVEGGTLAGSGGGGFYDTFRSRRAADGWHTEFSGLSGVQAEEPYAGQVSADHAYSLWQVLKQKGSLPADQYLRGPGGTIEVVGLGSLGTGEARGRWVSSGAAHLIFTSATRLEPNAPSAGTTAIYDRSPGGPTHVVSLLPGEAIPAPGENADYLDTAEEGTAVVFHLGGAIYVRLNNAETLKVADDPATYGGIAADGSRVFYIKSGNAFAFETATQATATIGSGGESTLVNVSADGSNVYFVSPLVLTGTEANSQGASAAAGEENLYAWDSASDAVRFVATVEEEDVVGEPPPAGGSSGMIGGLGLWIPNAVSSEQERFIGPANDPSRTSPDGDVFVFESRAKLTAYNNEGHSEVYRYDAASTELGCVSCNPTGAPAVSEARLESRYAPLLFSIPPVNAISEITNVAAGGDVVFFQSADRLAAADRDGRVDVYEWHAQGAQGCERKAGCIRLVSGGHSSADDYLYGASKDGSSVFFLSADRLVSQDTSSTPSIYAAREGGGFAPSLPPEPECAGESCQPAAAVPDGPPTASSLTWPSNPVPTAKRSCPKGKHRIKGKGGRASCAKRHRRNHRRAHHGTRAGR